MQPILNPKTIARLRPYWAFALGGVDSWMAGGRCSDFRSRSRIQAILLFFALIPASAGVANATCTQGDPAITSVVVTSVTHQGGVNVYHLAGHVINLGRKKQASNALEFVGIYEDGVRRDERSIPALKGGESYTFHYDYTRSSDAGPNTTDLNFRLGIRDPSPSGWQGCSLANGRYVLQF